MVHLQHTPSDGRRMPFDIDAELAKIGGDEAELAELEAEFEWSFERFVKINSALYPARRTWSILDHKIALWEVAESWCHIRTARVLIPWGHRMRRDALWAAAVAMWREWLAALSAQVSDIWEDVRLPWAMRTGLAPPPCEEDITTIVLRQ
jgi:hypothetical protein